jgi:hypothetical protein
MSSDNVVNLHGPKTEYVNVQYCNNCDKSLYYISVDGAVICSTCLMRVGGCKVVMDATNDTDE